MRIFLWLSFDGTAFLPVNFLFLFLGVLLYTFKATKGLMLGNVSFDDRALIRFGLSKSSDLDKANNQI